MIGSAECSAYEITRKASPQAFTGKPCISRAFCFLATNLCALAGDDDAGFVARGGHRAQNCGDTESRRGAIRGSMLSGHGLIREHLN
jgi:hypothetical protein